MRVLQSDSYASWRRTADKQLVLQADIRIRRIIAAGKPVGDWKSEGNGILALRFRSGLRIYFHWDGHDLLLLLAAGTKRRQEKDIRKAAEELQAWKEQE